MTRHHSSIVSNAIVFHNHSIFRNWKITVIGKTGLAISNYGTFSRRGKRLFTGKVRLDQQLRMIMQR